jgi:hypothetical protein
VEKRQLSAEGDASPQSLHQCGIDLETKAKKIRKTAKISDLFSNFVTQKQQENKKRTHRTLFQ